jgi:hypothetical protein
LFQRILHGGTLDLIKKIFNADYLIWFADQIGTTVEGIFTGFFGRPNTLSPNPLTTVSSSMARSGPEAVEILDYIWTALRDELVDRVGFDLRPLYENDTEATWYALALHPDCIRWMISQGLRLNLGAQHPLYQTYARWAQFGHRSPVYLNRMMHFWFSLWWEKGYPLPERGSPQVANLLPIVMTFDVTGSKWQNALQLCDSVALILASGVIDAILSDPGEFAHAEAALAAWFETAPPPTEEEKAKFDEILEYEIFSLSDLPVLEAATQKFFCWKR